MAHTPHRHRHRHHKHTQHTRQYTPNRCKQAHTTHNINHNKGKAQTMKKKHTQITKQDRVKAVEQVNAVMAHIEKYAQARRYAHYIAAQPKNEGKRWCNTRSRWQQTQEERVANELAPADAPAIHRPRTTHEIVILYDRRTRHGDIYEVVNEHRDTGILEVKKPHRTVQVKVAAHEHEPDDTEVVVQDMIMSARQMYISLLSTATRIYDIEGIV